MEKIRQGEGNKAEMGTQAKPSDLYHQTTGVPGASFLIIAENIWA
jgi:hypothetical protein